jgi:hypothetical protein
MDYYHIVTNYFNGHIWFDGSQWTDDVPGITYDDSFYVQKSVTATHYYSRSASNKTIVSNGTITRDGWRTTYEWTSSNRNYDAVFITRAVNSSVDYIGVTTTQSGTKTISTTYASSKSAHTPSFSYIPTSAEDWFFSSGTEAYTITQYAQIVQVTISESGWSTGFSSESYSYKRTGIWLKPYYDWQTPSTQGSEILQDLTSFTDGETGSGGQYTSGTHVGSFAESRSYTSTTGLSTSAGFVLEYSYTNGLDRGATSKMEYTQYVSIGVGRDETLYYLDNSGQNWSAPKSLVGPASTTMSCRKVKFANSGYFGSTIGVQVVHSSNTTATEETVSFSEITGTAEGLSYTDRFTIFGATHDTCSTFVTETVQLWKAETYTKPRIATYYETSLTNAYYRYRSQDGSGEARVRSVTFFNPDEEIFRKRQILGMGGDGFPDFTPWYCTMRIYAWGSGQNGFIDPLGSSFYSKPPEFSTWTRATGNTEPLKIALANNFVQAEIPKTYKSSRSISFSVEGEGSGAPLNSGIWNANSNAFGVASACIPIYRVHEFYSDQDVVGRIFNGAHETRPYEIYGKWNINQNVILKEFARNGYKNPQSIRMFDYPNGVNNKVSTNLASGEVYEVFGQRYKVSDVLGSTAAGVIISQAAYKAEIIGNKAFQARRWINYTADFNMHVIVPPRGGGGGGGGGGY